MHKNTLACIYEWVRTKSSVPVKWQSEPMCTHFSATMRNPSWKMLDDPRDDGAVVRMVLRTMPKTMPRTVLPGSIISNVFALAFRENEMPNEPPPPKITTPISCLQAPPTPNIYIYRPTSSLSQMLLTIWRVGSCHDQQRQFRSQGD